MTYAAELLPEHDHRGCQRRSTVSGNSEQLDELPKEAFASVGLSFEFNADICIVSVSCRLKIGESNALERSESLVMLAVLDIPSRDHCQFQELLTCLGIGVVGSAGVTCHIT